MDGGARSRVRAPELPILMGDAWGLKSESFSMVTAGAIAGSGCGFRVDCSGYVVRRFAPGRSVPLFLVSDSVQGGWRNVYGAVEEEGGLKAVDFLKGD
jgi:hypothetical protein